MRSLFLVFRANAVAPRTRPIPALGWRRRSRRIGLDFAAAGVALACFYPFHLAIDVSLRALAALDGQRAWPAMPSPAEWLALLRDMLPGDGAGARPATLGMAVAVVGVALFLGTTARYAFGGGSVRARAQALPLLGATLLPQVMVLSCLFDLPGMQHVYNHWWGLAMPCLTFTLPFAVWGALAFAESRPAHRGGPAPEPPGAGWPGLPTALLATALLAFIAAWGEFMYALTQVVDSTQSAAPAMAAGKPALLAALGGRLAGAGLRGSDLATAGLVAAGLAAAALAAASCERRRRRLRRSVSRRG